MFRQRNAYRRHLARPILPNSLETLERPRSGGVELPEEGRGARCLFEQTRVAARAGNQAPQPGRAPRGDHVLRRSDLRRQGRQTRCLRCAWQARLRVWRAPDPKAAGSLDQVEARTGPSTAPGVWTEGVIHVVAHPGPRLDCHEQAYPSRTDQHEHAGPPTCRRIRACWTPNLRARSRAPGRAMRVQTGTPRASLPSRALNKSPDRRQTEWGCPGVRAPLQPWWTKPPILDQLSRQCATVPRHALCRRPSAPLARGRSAGP